MEKTGVNELELIVLLMAKNIFTNSKSLFDLTTAYVYIYILFFS